jgi:CubicO group peptidase (beta-lactamase class C family)
MSKKHYLLTLILVVYVVGAAFSQTSVTNQIDELLSKVYPATEPGAAVLVVKDNKVIYKKGYGLASLNPAKPVTPELIFRIGSITKQFTSIAILKLAEQGKLDLNASITTYLPEFSTQGNVVTVEHLLNHTSGIKSYTSLPEIVNTEKKGQFMAINEMLQVIQKQPFDFSPNDQWLYNNSGYYLLGAIIEKVSGVSYTEYVTKNLFKPVGMKSSYVEDPKLPNGITQGYSKVSSTEYRIADYIHPSIPYAAGAIFSTVEDLWKWNQAVFSNKLVKQAWLDKAWSPTILNNKKQISYGYGWSLSRLGNSKVIGHGGAIDGFLTFEMYVPDIKLYVCILSNNMSAGPEEYAYQIAEMVAGIKHNNHSVVSVNEQAAQEYVGVYKISENEERIISMKGNQFYSQRTGGPKFEIFPYVTDAFYFKDSPSRLRFIRNNEGKIEAMEMNGREFIAQVCIKTNKPVPQDKVEVEIDVAVFDKYVGEYELAPGFIIKVWRDDTLFKAQATGQPPFEIFAESESKFFLKVVDAQLEFKKDDLGKVTELVLQQGGNEMPGKKIK